MRLWLDFVLPQKTECEHEPNNLFQLRIYKGGLIKACAANKTCGEVFADLKL